MKGKGNFGGMQQLLRQANQMQLKMKDAQDKLAQQEYESSTGGGAVQIKVRGENQVVSIKLSPDLAKSGDVEMLQDLLLTAINEVLKKAKESHSQEMEKITGGFNFPGL